jgi:hypothetical protein
MKQCYIPKKFGADTLALIETINDIVEEYQADDLVLTVRQLYYQLVARDVIPNTLQSYKRAASIINDAKHAGYIDWDMIEDRTRSFVRRPSWSGGGEIIQACANSFHMDLWKGQQFRVFTIIEKEALVGVLDKVCRENDVPILAARGYPSGSVLREFAMEDMRPALRAGQHPIILHLGDHDPSGIDMTRDLTERLELYVGRPVTLHRLALNMRQIEEENPPENPAKTTDARYASYERQYGTSSWELDALSPRYLSSLVEDSINEYVDQDLRSEREVEIEDVKTRLQEVADEFNQE